MLQVGWQAQGESTGDFPNEVDGGCNQCVTYFWVASHPKPAPEGPEVLRQTVDWRFGHSDLRWPHEEAGLKIPPQDARVPCAM
jgi:hypothetical protein